MGDLKPVHLGTTKHVCSIDVLARWELGSPSLIDWDPRKLGLTWKLETRTGKEEGDPFGGGEDAFYTVTQVRIAGRYVLNRGSLRLRAADFSGREKRKTSANEKRRKTNKETMRGKCPLLVGVEPLPSVC